MVGMLGMLIDASQGSRTVGFDGAISDLATSWTSWAGLDSAFRGWYTLLPLGESAIENHRARNRPSSPEAENHER